MVSFLSVFFIQLRITQNLQRIKSIPDNPHTKNDLTKLDIHSLVNMRFFTFITLYLTASVQGANAVVVDEQNDPTAGITDVFKNLNPLNLTVFIFKFIHQILNPTNQHYDQSTLIIVNIGFDRR